MRSPEQSNAVYAVQSRAMRYWVRTLALIIVGLLVGHWLEETETWTAARYRVYQWLDSVDPWGAPKPRDSILILIGDDEYWAGDLAGRAPLKRDYLGRLVEAVAQLEPAVIALDFNLRSSMGPHSPVEHQAYANERRDFIASLDSVSKRVHLVLPRTTRWNRRGHFTLERAVYDFDPTYDSAGMDPDLSHASGIEVGYIEGDPDVRRVPLLADTGGGDGLKSLSLAVVSAYRPQVVADIIRRHANVFPYARFISPTDFKPFQFSASDVLRGQIDRSAIRSRVVIIGAGWHSRGFGSGPLVDLYDTPVGPLNGAQIHATYVEALLSRGTFAPLSSAVLKCAEAALLFLLAVILFRIARSSSLTPARMGVISCAAAVVGVGILIVADYLLLKTLGIYSEMLIPVVVVSVHPFVEFLVEHMDFTH